MITSNTKSNYKNRRARGQCATCTRPSERFRCDACRVKANEYFRQMRAARRERGECTKCGSSPCLCPKKKRKMIRLADRIADELVGINTTEPSYFDRLDMLEAIEVVLSEFGVTLWKKPPNT